MTGQLELWAPGWDIEPCHDSPPDPGLAAQRLITADFGRPAGRPTRWGEPVTTIQLAGDLL